MPMILSIHCPTCESKLVVKNEELLGKILPCPKCGGMVLVELPPQESPVSPPASALSKTDAVAPVMREETPLMTTDSAAVPSKPTPPPVPFRLSEKEMKTRKIMLAFLGGLIVVLILITGILFAVKKPTRDVVEPKPMNQQANLQPNIAAPVVPPVNERNIVEPEANPSTPADETEPVDMPEIATDNDGVDTPLPDGLSAQDDNTTETPVNSAEQTIPESAGILNNLESKLPGLVDSVKLFRIDISERLERRMVALRLNGTPLVDVLRFFEQLTEVPITLDIDECRSRNIAATTPLTFTCDDGAVGNRLTEILEIPGLEPIIEDKQILATVPNEKRDRLEEKSYDISDFSEKTPTPDQFVAMIVTFIDPLELTVVSGETREQQDEKPTIRIDGRVITVRHRFTVQTKILHLIEQLRVLRRLPQKTKIVGEQLVPEVMGWDAVSASLTLNYYEQTPLFSVLRQIESATGMRILVDHQSLHRSLAPLREMYGIVNCNNGTINQALEELLASIDTASLTYRIITPTVLEVTTHATAKKPEKMTVEIHRVPPNVPTESLVEKIKTSFAPESWQQPDDSETFGLGCVVFDAPSGCLIVRQSQPVQRQIRIWFDGQSGQPVGE